ncbi:MAG: GYD domain-containing protein [Acidimicrobiia bacterium]|nr:GYD domain-containing protein [Acidimicrobiia bacterium]
MPRYMSLIKYTPDALAGVRASGFKARFDQLEKVTTAHGGTLISMDFVADDRYDFVAVFELPDHDAFFALNTFSFSLGAIADGMALELYTADQADAALAKSQATDYRPPSAT